MIWEERCKHILKDLKKSNVIGEWDTIFDFLWDDKIPKRMARQLWSYWEEQEWDQFSKNNTLLFFVSV
jgi:hypothetical protein